MQHDLHPTNRAGYGSAAGILLFALALRLAFANGALGSDDLVYLARALDVAEGHWTSANYNGALRYGFNIPAGLFLRAFGVSEFVANVWPLTCSMAEIGAVYWFASVAWGARHAAVAALLLAVAPLHIASATRIHADPVVSLFLTLAFVLLFVGERRRHHLLLFLGGVCLGLVFWVKELAIVTAGSLALYPLLWRRFPARLIYFVTGAALIVGANFVLMLYISGDPMHLVKVVTGQVSRSFLGQMAGEDGAFYYFRFLFADIRHTLLLGFGALAAVVAWLRSRAGSTSARSVAAAPDALDFSVFWLLSLLAVLSFLPVSLSPLRLTMKQSNYITLFMAPLAVLSAWVVAAMPRPVAIALALVSVIGGVLLGALQQQAYRVFAANSRAVAQMLSSDSTVRVYGSTNNGNMVHLESLLAARPQLRTRFGYLSDLKAGAPPLLGGGTAYVVLDEETLTWGGRPPAVRTPQTCWVYVSTLSPIGFGLGQWIPVAAAAVSSSLPSAINARLSGTIASMVRPKPARLYRVDSGDPLCGGGRPAAG